MLNYRNPPLAKKATSGETMRVLIADDSEVLRERLIENVSEIENIEIVGQEGNAKRINDSVERLKPDLVIMDIKMPGGSGIQALESLKKRENPPMIIMFTNFPYLQYRKKCMDLGADYFFYKSTEFEKLLEIIKNTALAHIQKIRKKEYL